MGDIDFSGSNEVSIRAHCIAGTADYAVAILAAGHQLCTDWARSVRERVPVPAEPVPPFAAATEAPPRRSKRDDGRRRSRQAPEVPATPAAPPTATDLVASIAARAELTVQDLRSVKRTKLFVTVRQEAMYALRMQHDWSYPQIGQFLRRDHSSVIHGARKHAERNGLPAPR